MASLTSPMGSPDSQMTPSRSMIQSLAEAKASAEGERGGRRGHSAVCSEDPCSFEVTPRSLPGPAGGRCQLVGRLQYPRDQPGKVGEGFGRRLGEARRLGFRRRGRARHRRRVESLGGRRHRPGTEVGDAFTGHLGGPLPVGTEHADVEGAVAHPGLVEQPGRRVLQIANHPDGGEGPEPVPGRVDLPPGEALSGRGRQVVVVVVPPLSPGDQGDDHGVPAGVRGGVAAPAHQVGHGVDQERPVPQQHGGEEEPDDQSTPSADEPSRPGPTAHGPEPRRALHQRSSG